MPNRISIKITFNDRLGFIADISNQIVSMGLNINSMELKKNNSTSFLFVGIDYQINFNQELFVKNIKAINNVIDILFIPFLPHIEKEIRYQIVLDSISDGIISVDINGNITNINQVASKIMGFKPDEIIGKNISIFNLDFSDIYKSLKKQKVTSTTKTIKTNNGKVEYLSICKPIIDNNNATIGAIEIMKSVSEIKELAKTIDNNIFTFDDIITENKKMLETIQIAKKAALTNSTILITGESGTGKECFANAIHNYSKRKGSLITINCAAIPESLIESELFGYEPSSFTGAMNKTKIGLIESANNGTLFLDEISELPLTLQAKFLRVLQERKIRRIGSNKEISIDIKLITATNQHLETLVTKKLFREDLYYRINVFPIFIPPLKNRLEDIPKLSYFFLEQLNNNLDKKVNSLTNNAIDKLLKYDWKGNVRELKNIIERAFVLTPFDYIDENHLIFDSKILPNTESDFNNLTNTSLKESVDKYEKKLIEKAMKKSLSIRKTAKLLGISHVALLNKIKKYNIT